LYGYSWETTFYLIYLHPYYWIIFFNKISKLNNNKKMKTVITLKVQDHLDFLFLKRLKLQKKARKVN